LAMLELLFFYQLARNPLEAIARRWYCRSLFRASRGRRGCPDSTHSCFVTHSGASPPKARWRTRPQSAKVRNIKAGPDRARPLRVKEKVADKVFGGARALLMQP